MQHSLFFVRAAVALTAGLTLNTSSAQTLENPLADMAPGRAGPASQAQVIDPRSLATKGLLRNLDSSAQHDWKTHMPARENKENYDCPLSLAFGGELQANGYRGVKLFGKAISISKPPEAGSSAKQ